MRETRLFMEKYCDFFRKKFASVKKRYLH